MSSSPKVEKINAGRFARNCRNLFYFAFFVGVLSKLFRFFLLLLSLSCRRFGVTREKIFCRENITSFISLCRGIIIIIHPQRATFAELFFILSLDDNSAHARDGSFCQRAREYIQRERERLIAHNTHTKHTHFFSSLCGDRDELNGLLFIGAFFCLFRRREQQQQREKKRNSRGFWRQLQR